MTHDPLCPDREQMVWGPTCSNCDLIAKVREDQRIRTLNAVQNGSTVMDVFGTYYGQGLSAAREAVATIGHDGDNRNTMPTMRGHWVLQAAALAAIDALRDTGNRIGGDV